MKYDIQDTQILSGLMDHIPHAIFWKDKDLVFRGCNKKFALQFNFEDPKDLIGKNDFDFPFSKDMIEKYNADDRRVLSGISMENIEETQRQPDGTIKTVVVSKIPIYSKGEVVGVLGLYFDISDRKVQEQELQSAKEKAEFSSRAKSNFIANMSHDIRAPITGMVGMVQDILETMREARLTLKDATSLSHNDWVQLLKRVTSHIEKDSDILLGSVKELLALCTEILEIARLESNAATPEEAVFDLRDITHRTVNFLQVIAQNKNLTLQAEIDERIPQYLLGLKTYLERSLQNLVSNALKFTDQGSVKILVKLSSNTKRTYRPGDEITLQIQIEDTGVGIPEDKFETIFEHFSRLTSSHSGTYKGSGLGLYTVKRYVETMKGNVSLTSKVGQGSCFTLTLPFIVSDEASYAAAPSSAPQFDTPEMRERLLNSIKPAATPIRILLVEDNKGAALAVTVTLKPFNCTIDSAENAAIAIEHARNNTYDLILMDVGLPDMEGTEATKIIRAFPNPERANVPIVGLTGHADNPEAKQECLEAGMQEVLGKPAQLSSLNKIFQRFVRKATAHSEPETPPATQNHHSDEQIDWKASAEKLGGNEALVRTLITMVAQDLESATATLEQAYAAKDPRGIRTELHRILGAVVYICLPPLESSLKRLQAIVTAEPTDTTQWDAPFAALKQAISDFQAFEKSLA